MNEHSWRELVGEERPVGFDQVAIGVASILAWGFVAITTLANTCFPLCVIYNDSNPEWYLFLCYLC